MNAWQRPAWNLDICLRVCPLRLRISCTSVCARVSVGACVTVCNVCMPTFLKFPYLTVDMCASQAFLDRGTLSASTECFQRPPPHTHIHTHTQTRTTHPTADTCMSPRQPDTVQDMLLTEKQRPPGQRFSTWSLGQLLGSLVES